MLVRSVSHSTLALPLLRSFFFTNYFVSTDLDLLELGLHLVERVLLGRGRVQRVRVAAVQAEQLQLGLRAPEKKMLVATEKSERRRTRRRKKERKKEKRAGSPSGGPWTLRGRQWTWRACAPAGGNRASARKQPLNLSLFLFF